MDAAKIDGCSDIKIFFKVILPLVEPAILTLAIFTFLGAWNNFYGLWCHVTGQR